MCEEGVHEAGQQGRQARQGESWLERDPIVDHGAAGGLRERAFVLPAAHAQHGRALVEASSGLELGDHEVVEVEGEYPEES